MVSRQMLLDAEELARIGSFEMQLDTGAITWSPGMYRIHGLEADGPVHVDEFLARVHPEDAPALHDLLDTVLERPGDVPAEGVRMEYRTTTPEGPRRHVRFHTRLLGRRLIGVMQDVTDLRVAELALRAHYGVNQALREWESFEEGAVGLLRRLGTALSCVVGTLWVPEEGRLQPRACWSANELADGTTDFVNLTMQSTFAFGEGGPGEVWASGRPLLFPDLTDRLPSRRRAAALEAGLRSAIGLAAPAGGEVRAVIGLYGRDPLTDAEGLERTLRDIGHELGRFLVRRRAQFAPRRLSRRELEVLRCAAEGLSGPQIAERLVVSPATVKTHFENIYEKLGVGDRAAAVAHALRTGLID